MTDLNIGDKMPCFSLVNQDNETITLENFQSKWLVLFAYPKDNTPACTDEAIDFSENLEKFHNLGANVLGISPDNIESHKKFIAKKDLKVSLLSDTNKELLSTLGIWVEKSMFGKKYMGVQRTTYLINPQGKIAYIWHKVKVKNHIEDVIKKLQELK